MLKEAKSYTFLYQEQYFHNQNRAISQKTCSFFFFFKGLLLRRYQNATYLEHLKVGHGSLSRQLDRLSHRLNWKLFHQPRKELHHSSQMNSSLLNGSYADALFGSRTKFFYPLQRIESKKTNFQINYLTSNTIMSTVNNL